MQTPDAFCVRMIAPAEACAAPPHWNGHLGSGPAPPLHCPVHNTMHTTSRAGLSPVQHIRLGLDSAPAGQELPSVTQQRPNGMIRDGKLSFWNENFLFFLSFFLSFSLGTAWGLGWQACGQPTEFEA